MTAHNSIPFNVAKLATPDNTITESMSTAILTPELFCDAKKQAGELLARAIQPGE